jgi:hypothetical protein
LDQIRQPRFAPSPVLNQVSDRKRVFSSNELEDDLPRDFREGEAALIRFEIEDAELINMQKKV